MSLHENSKKWQNKQHGATSWMLKAIKKWIWMLFWVELLKFMMLPTCQSKFFFKFQKFTFFEFPNHNCHSTALWAVRRRVFILCCAHYMLITDQKVADKLYMSIFCGDFLNLRYVLRKKIRPGYIMQITRLIG